MSYNILPTFGLTRSTATSEPVTEEKKGNLQGRSAMLIKMRSDLDSFLGKGSLVFRQANEKFKTAFAPAEIKSTPVQLAANTEKKGSFQGRMVNITHNMKSKLISCLGKSSLLLQQRVEKIKGVFFQDNKQPELIIEEIDPIVKEPLTPLPPIDLAYLNPKDSAYNMKRLSEMTTRNAIESVCTEDILKTVPTNVAMTLGYNDPAQYQTVLADQVIVGQVALTALSILGITLGNIFACRASNQYPKFIHCVQSTAQIWQHTPGKVFLAVSALLLGASFYAHNKGWIGSQLYDRLLREREKKLDMLFQDISKELFIQATLNPVETKNIARKIARNAELIESTLRMDLGISQAKTKIIVDGLKKSCQDILDPKLLSVKTEAPLSTKEMKV